MENPGHYCYDCDTFFRDSDPNVTKHKGCKTKKGLGICVDKKEFGKYHYFNLEDKSKGELIQIIQKLTEK
jgi:hypothetical protein